MMQAFEANLKNIL